MPNGLISEYEALRSEILNTYTRRATVQSIGTILFAGLHSVALTSNFPEIGLAGNIILMAFFADDLRWSTATSKIGAYVKEIIEPRVPGINWQYALANCDPSHQPRMSLGFLNLLSRYPTTILAGLLGSALFLRFEGEGIGMKRLSVGYFLVFLETLIFLFVWFKVRDLGKVHKTWQEKFRKLAQKIAEADAKKPNIREKND